MNFKAFKEKKYKKLSIVFFTLACLFLIIGVILYRAYAIYDVIKDRDLLNGHVEDAGDIYFAFYQDDILQKEMPKKESGYVLDEEKSYCGVNGTQNEQIKVSLTEDWQIIVSGVTTSRTKCNLYFVKGVLIMGHGVPTLTNGDGLYEINHDDPALESGWNQKEYRYVGGNSKNIVKFNNENWRIIGLVNVLTSESKIEQRVKIMRDHDFGLFPWDFQCENVNSCSVTVDWKNSSLQTLFNEKYFHPTPFTYYYRDYIDSQVYSDTLDLSNFYLKDKSASMIDTVFWNIGNLDTQQYNNTKDINLLYRLERQNQETWQGKIALFLPSDAVYTFSGTSSFLNLETWYWHLRIIDAAYSQVGTLIYSISSLGIHFSSDTAWYNHRGFPSLYLKPDVTILSGTGSSSDPYQIAEIIKNS